MKMILFTLLPLIASCATLKQHSTIGAIAGVVGGAVIGYGIPAPNKNQHKSIAFGASLGASFGWLLGKLSEQSKETKPAPHLESNEEIIHELPNLSQPTIKRIWIPDRIEGDQYIKGHFIYVIQQKPYWQKTGEAESSEADPNTGANGKDQRVDSSDKPKSRQVPSTGTIK